jgi:hypothetical protein
MEKRECGRIVCTAAVAMIALAAMTGKAQANILANPGFELSTSSPVGWTTFGNVFMDTNPQPAPVGAHSGTNSLKEFGTFPGVSGAFQSFSLAPGLEVDLDGWIVNASSDPMQAQPNNTNFALVKISFQDAGNNELLGIDSQHITALTPQDIWQHVNCSGIAPAGTTHVNLFCLFVQPQTLGGSAAYDDINAVIVPEPGTIALVLTGLGGLVMLAKRRRA